MTVFDLLLLLISTFGALVFGTLTVTWVLERIGSGPVSPCSGRQEGGHWVNSFIALYTTLWFVVNAVTAFGSLYPDEFIAALRIALLSMTFMYPPLILHIHYVEFVAVNPEAKLGPQWKWILRASYPVAITAGSLPILTYFWGDLTEAFGRLMGFVMMALFVLTAVYCILLNRKSRRATETTEERTNRFWQVMLWILIFVSFPVLLLGGRGALYDLLNVLTRSFPLIFVFISFYYLERFRFFDVFVKRGMFALLLLLFLVGYFSVLPVRLAQGEGAVAGTWLYALTLLPAALALPWLYRQMELWLDRVWLGRIFTPVEAVKYFLSGVQDATSEADLLKEAERRFSRIFQAPALISVSGNLAPRPLQGEVEVAIGSTPRIGLIRLGRRENNMPFFSADLTLISSLADVLSGMIENVRLQERKQQQEKRARELEIHASRSELKALRAQINPHFLFNALNAIAGLIHGNPDRAEETVEQLAEVFRYTLQGSEKEWARLEDEMDFVRAYLEVEKARFGKRLETVIDLDESVRDVRFPVMMIQTLVENAVKHGVASVRGVGQIRIRAFREATGLRVEVIDNGPGLDQIERQMRRSGTGYGLKNVRDRLKGYFGNKATLSLRRDEAGKFTVASLSLPDPDLWERRKTS